MEASNELFAFRPELTKPPTLPSQPWVTSSKKEQHGQDIHHKPFGCDNDDCHVCYLDALFGTTNCKRRLEMGQHAPKYIGKEEDKKDFLIDFEAPSSSRSASTNESSLSGSWDDCMSFPLLQLPKEIRLLIYEFSFPSSSCPIIVEFDRDTNPQQGYCPLPKKQREPKLRYNRNPNTHTNGGLVATCKIIHEEATSLLYQNIIFQPKDNEGLLPLFLQRQQELATRSIQCIRLNMDLFEPKPQARFHWAITCAQVSRLGSTLGRVEVQFCNEKGLSSQTLTKTVLRPLLKPLCKISCPKSLILRGDLSLQDHSSLLESFHFAIEEGEKAMAERCVRDANIKKLKVQEEEQEGAKDSQKLAGEDEEQDESISDSWDTMSDISYDSEWEYLKDGYDQYEDDLKEYQG